MTRSDYENILADQGDTLSLAATHETNSYRARILRLGLSESGTLPSSLRAPLMAVEDHTELPGSAEDILQAAEELLA